MSGLMDDVCRAIELAGCEADELGMQDISKQLNALLMYATIIEKLAAEKAAR